MSLPFPLWLGSLLFLLLVTVNNHPVDAIHFGQPQHRLREDASVSFTILHVTDVHGWLYGHRHNATLDADFGDLLDLNFHLAKQASQNGNSEVLLLDTGDLIEGTGLSDATPIHGQDIFPIAPNMPTVASTAGNHDIGHEETVAFMKDSGFTKSMGNRYVTTNLIYKPTGDFLGVPFSVYTTPNTGKRVLFLGFIYNFNQNADNTIVIPIDKAVQSDVFIKAVTLDQIDMVVALCHIDPEGQSQQLYTIYQAIRHYQPHTPLVMLTGHAHRFYSKKCDENCIILESSCYMQWLGVIRFDLSPSHDMQGLTTQWIPATRQTFWDFTHTNNGTFPTQSGQQIRDQINGYINSLNLRKRIGCSPQTYSVYEQLSSPASFYGLLVQSIVPDVQFPFHKGANTPFFITNTAFLRYNLFAGDVLVDDIWTCIPFRDRLMSFNGVNGTFLQLVLSRLGTIPMELVFRDRMGSAAPVVNSELPSWVYTLGPVEPQAIYDILVTEYDSVSLRTLFTFPAVLFDTPLDSTQMLSQFVSTHMSCSV